MFNKSIDSFLKDNFDVFYSQGKQKAKDEYKVKVTSKIIGLNHFETLKFYIGERNRIKELISSDPHPYYLENYSDEDLVLTQYASRHFLLGIEEGPELINSIYLGFYSAKVYGFINNTRKKISKYTFNQFLGGEICKYYIELEDDVQYKKPFYIESLDYSDILEWQSNSFINIVVYDATLAIKKYQKYLKNTKNPLNLIKQELIIIEEELLPNIIDGEKLKLILSKLFLFKDFNFIDYDNYLLSTNYAIFNRDGLDFRKITPLSVGSVLDKVMRNSQTIVSNEVTVFYLIEKLSFWLKSIINGRHFEEPYSFPLWSEELNELLNKGILVGAEIGKELTVYADCAENTKDEIKLFLVQQLECYRSEFSYFESEELFSLFAYSEETNLACAFKVECFLNNDSQKFKDSLLELVKIKLSLDVVSEFYLKFLNSTTLEISSKYPSINPTFLFYEMFLDKELYNKIEGLYNDMMHHSVFFSIPLPILRETQKENYSRLFAYGMSKLKEVLEGAELKNKIMYLQSRLKNIRERELRAVHMVDEVFNSAGPLRYINIFKDFLLIQSDFIKETATISLEMVLPNQTKNLVTKEPISNNKQRVKKIKHESFTYVGKPSERSKLTDLRNALISKNLIEKNTKLKDFNKVFSGDFIEEPIVWKGNISELTYLIKQLHNKLRYVVYLKQEHWVVAVKCFIQQNGERYERARLRGQKKIASTKNIDLALNTLK
ncbi:hypothetical protein [Polaribacter glomeratus]|uniref:Uncharacterized protein n=1 Tax=Polaribacter glomeratus TaxID=102 RepID=A0A2S7WZ52_9FLAO|nr:hypothetical protein [Polaribacter glomeratus]PQJ82701.1 hypothetical protein BTO16_08985 [Polaribacter glomeratus]TXD63728.1 hypothetical protein ESX12_17120 [Polaribacter glomeratus]